jgi:hypothetical protein
MIMNEKLKELFRVQQIKADALMRVENKLVREGLFSAELMKEFLFASNGVIAIGNEILEELELQSKLLRAEAGSMKFWLN